MNSIPQFLSRAWMLDSDLPVLSELTHRIEQIAGVNAQQNRGAEMYQVRREGAESGIE